MWASSPGSAPKIKPTTGISMYSNGTNHPRQAGTVAGLGGLCFDSIISMIIKKESAIVRMIEERPGSVYPITVLENSGLSNTGAEMPSVMINQFTGQRKWSRIRVISLKVFVSKGTFGVKRKFFIT